MYNAEDYITDIPVATARAAFYGVSWSSARRGDQYRAEYAQQLAEDHGRLADIAARYGTEDILAQEFPRFRAGYRSRFLSFLNSNARCVSCWIAGPSNFPARRMAKRHDVAMRRGQEIYEYRAKAIAAIRRKISPAAFISSGDADALDQLETRIAGMKHLQARMREVNAAIRKHKKQGPAAQVTALVELGIHPAAAAAMLEPDELGRVGYPDYELTNHGANIRRLEGRIIEITRKRQQPTLDSLNETTGIRLELAPDENRVRLHFPGKPDASTIASLKANGFRWAPTLQAWSAYHNYHTVQFATAAASTGEGE